MPLSLALDFMSLFSGSHDPLGLGVASPSLY